ncbi:MAG TPA: hypothetical protein VLV54_06170 [Thermoanaerobaculia bacterium]|nr:hypothetical protein [Thermoanaerobaculia bacterium]
MAICRGTATALAQPARSRHGEREPLGPFHHLHPRSGQQLVETEPRGLLRRKPVEVDVDQASATPLVLADEIEGRRLYLPGVNPQSLADAAGEHGLAAAQLARKQENAVRRQLQGQGASQLAGLRLAMSDDERGRDPRRLRRLPPSIP